MTVARSAGIPVASLLGLPEYDDPDPDTGDAAGAGDGSADASGTEPGQAPPDGSQGDETGEGAPPADPDPSSSPAGQQPGDQADADASRIKQLSDEAAKYRHRAKAAEDSVEQAQKTITELRIENAYIRHAITVVDDLDAGRKLADFAGVTIDEDGTVHGMKEVVAALIRHYPYLERQPDTQPYAAPGSGGTPANGRRKTTVTTSRAALEKKYPALRGR